MRLLKAWIQQWLSMPSSLTGKGRWGHGCYNNAIPLAWTVHFAFIFLFLYWYWQVLPLAIFNILSVLMWPLAFFTKQPFTYGLPFSGKGELTTMKTLHMLILALLFASFLMSCARPRPEPGDGMGNIRVEEHAGGTRSPDLGEYCGGYQSMGMEPGVHTIDCEVPLLPRLKLEFGWGAKDTAILDSNWNAMIWELHIDGQQINLDVFTPWSETSSGIVGSQTLEVRGWRLDLVNLSPGKHTLRLLWRSATPIDDGFDVYPAGTYENIVNFTVLEQ